MWTAGRPLWLEGERWGAGGEDDIGTQGGNPLVDPGNAAHVGHDVHERWSP